MDTDMPFYCGHNIHRSNNDYWFIIGFWREMLFVTTLTMSTTFSRDSLNCCWTTVN